MKRISLFVKRSVLNESTRLDMLQQYDIEIIPDESTLLECLQTIQEKIDDTLAVRYGCRYKQCGLCAITVDGNPKMACMTKARDGMILEPLDKIPVQKDLVVDRQFITEMIKEKELFPDALNTTKDLITNKKYDILNKCTDCQSCIAVCPEFDYNERDTFAGPLFFVKLAQLQNHPQNEYDYKEKAKLLGVDRCKDCNCRCPYGIPIKKFAIEPFLE